ncbi:MAG TPA: ArsI/CadI family heavy metal resistance metalloenzyme [Actinomycetota bacterium]
MSRVQLALTVSDVDAAVVFYEKLFGVPAAKKRPGYANFAIAEPPLKLVLLEGETPGLNHLGVEVETVEEVRQATERLAAEGFGTLAEQGACCYAEQDKVWVTGPDQERWEYYAVLGDADVMSASSSGQACACGDAVCC